MKRLTRAPLGLLTAAALLIPAALLTPAAQASTSAPQPYHEAAAGAARAALIAPAAATGSRHFHARTNYGAVTGLLEWDHTGPNPHVVVSGTLVDTARYPSTSSAYLCVGPGGGNCKGGIIYTLIQNLSNGASAQFAMPQPLPRSNFGAWVQECSVRQGTRHCSPWS